MAIFKNNYYIVVINQDKTFNSYLSRNGETPALYQTHQGAYHTINRLNLFNIQNVYIDVRNIHLSYVDEPEGRKITKQTLLNLEELNNAGKK